MAFFANQAKDQLIDYAKSQLIEQLKEKLNQGVASIDAGIDALFVELKEKLKSLTVLNKNVLQTILAPICVSKQEESVKTELKERIEKINFSEELKKMQEQMPGITDEIKRQIDALPKKLKEKLIKLIDDLITCDNVSANGNPDVATTGGYKQRDRKQKRRRKTKKRIYKKSRGRRQYSRK